MVSKIGPALDLLGSAFANDLRYRWLASLFPPRPVRLQFIAGDGGSLRQDAPAQEISVQALQMILSDALFSQVEQVEIAGAEPALRPNLPEIGQALLHSLPRLKKLEVITSRLPSPASVERLAALARSIQQDSARLGVSVPLDETCDPALETIRAVQQAGWSVSLACTLTPLNCYAADDVLLWCRQNGLPEPVFRLGIAPARPAGPDSGRLQPFTTEQNFHLALFFEKLGRYGQGSTKRRLFYRSLAGQLALGSPRRVDCDWQRRAVALDLHGSLRFCPVQSPVIGSALEKSAHRVFYSGLPERKRILRQHCASCPYDDLGPLNSADILQRGREILRAQARQRRIRPPRRPAQVGPSRPPDHPSPSDWRRVLITGWYGTETAGDKAILGEVLHFIRTRSPSCQVTLTTIDRKISQQTNRELADLQGATLVNIEEAARPQVIEPVDAVIFGGGPIMETSQLEYIRRMFVEANRQRKARIVFGCGVGPLHSETMRQVAGAILGMATAGFVRDPESLAAAQKLAPGLSLECACDPALAFLRRWTADHPGPSQPGEGRRIAGLLRANTGEFIPGLTRPELADSNTQAAQQIALILDQACLASGARADLLHMNAPWIGGDDRLFNRQVAGFFSHPEAVCVERGYLTLEALLTSLHQASAAVAMRYHGHLFCMALGIPFLSIDYTGQGGKVHNLVRRIGYEQWSEDWRKIDSWRAAAHLHQLLQERTYWSAYLKQQADILTSHLEKVYIQTFGFKNAVSK